MSASPDPTHYDGQDLEALADLANYTGWIVDRFAGQLRGRVLEVGAGIGNVSLRYLDRVDAAVLVEPAANLFATLQERVAGRPGVRCVQAMLHELPADLREPAFDAAIMVNVLEHIEDDAAVLRELFALVRPGGHVLLFVPALPLLYGSLDRLVHHCRRYRRGELHCLVGGAGFEIEACEYFDLFGVLPWFVAGRILRQRSFHAGSARTYDRVAVPITRAWEQRFGAPFGKSLICIARRPG